MESNYLDKLSTIDRYRRPFLYATLVIVFAMFISSLLYLINAKKTGSEIGNTVGTIVGNAVGSYDGWNHGYEEGKTEGLSAQDTVVTISSVINTAGKLHVLRAKVLISNALEVGTTDPDSFTSSLIGGKKYSALFNYKGQVDFVVDLRQARIDREDGTITIVLPLPVATLTVDESEVETLAEWQKIWFNGSDPDGVKAYNNSIAAIKEKTAEDLQNYDLLLDMAKSSAIKQIKTLAESIQVETEISDPVVKFDQGDVK